LQLTAAAVMEWAVGWQSNRDGQWNSGGAMDGTMGGRQLPADEGTTMRAMLSFLLVGEL
jgi:hypothetical protein